MGISKKNKAGKRLEINELGRFAILYKVVEKASEWRPEGIKMHYHSTSIPGKQKNK